MKIVLDFLIRYWLPIATIMSLFWGIRGVYLDYGNRIDGFVSLNRRPRRFYILFNWSIFQFIFNFAGSFAGWCCLYLLILRLQPNLLKDWNLSDFMLFLLSFLGITGLLPQSFYGLVESLERLAAAAINRLLG